MMQRIRTMLNKDEGFTLIELLIVIVILGILAAIVVFAVNGISDRGTVAACKADKESVTVASEAFFAKNSSYATAIADAPLTSASLVGGGFLHTNSNISGNTLTQSGYTITYTPASGGVASNLSGC